MKSLSQLKLDSLSIQWKVGGKLLLLQCQFQLEYRCGVSIGAAFHSMSIYSAFEASRIQALVPGFAVLNKAHPVSKPSSV